MGEGGLRFFHGARLVLSRFHRQDRGDDIYFSWLAPNLEEA